MNLTNLNQLPNIYSVKGCIYFDRPAYLPHPICLIFTYGPLYICHMPFLRKFARHIFIFPSIKIMDGESPVRIVMERFG